MIEKKVHSKKGRMTLASTKINFMLDLAKYVSDQTGMAEWDRTSRRYVEEGECRMVGSDLCCRMRGLER